MAPIVRPAWGFTSIDMLDLAYSLGPTAHWPLSDATFTTTPGNIEEVIGGSNGTFDYVSANGVLTSGNSIGSLSGTSAHFDAVYNNGVADWHVNGRREILLGHLPTANPATFIVFFRIDGEYTDIDLGGSYPGWAWINLDGLQLQLYHNSSSADTWRLGGVTKGNPNDLTNKVVMLVGRQTDATTANAYVYYNGARQETQAFPTVQWDTNVPDFRLSSWPVTPTSAGATGSIRYQHCMFFGGSALSDDELLALHLASL
jgi:hypothetical protein